MTEMDDLRAKVEALRAGPGWYEFIKRPEATTYVAYVHENGEVWVPDMGWTTAGGFSLLTEGKEDRLIGVDSVLALFGGCPMMTRDELIKAGTEILIAQGGAPGNSIHSWRCEDRERYPEPCTCAEDVVADILALWEPIIRAEEQAKALEFCCEDSGVEALTADRDAARAEMAELRGALDVAVGLLSEVGITCTIDSLIADRVERQDTDAATAEHWSNQTEEPGA